MNNKSEITMNNTSIIGNIISWLFGMVFFAIGVLNTFWGERPGFRSFYTSSFFRLFSSGKYHSQENGWFLNFWNGNSENRPGHFYHLGSGGRG